MGDAKKNYEQLSKISRQTKILNGISLLLEWDQEITMPPGASDIRAEQMKTLAGLTHKERTGLRFSGALEKLIDIDTGNIKAKGLPAREQRALKEWRRDYLKDIALPKKFVEDFAALSSQSINVWRQAKEDNNFSLFAPFLHKIVIMNKKKADLLGYNEHPYDALLDLYEPYVTTAEVTSLFKTLRSSISSLVKKIASAKQVNNDFLSGTFPAQKQLDFGKKILEAMGYDFNKGRLDLSTHPFSTSCHPTDSRITSRINPKSVLTNVLTSLHEGGHSLYEMGLPVEHYGTPLGEAISYGVHESQSRWWETRIGLSKPFWHYWLPHLKSEFKKEFPDVNLDDFYKGINQVNRSFIRVEADEVTYPLHVILRFELETALIDGSLSIKNVPEAWNQKMHELFGITPSTDREGCLQDIHWSMGAFGYFPTYTLGNLYASHLFLGFEKEHPNWKELLQEGKLDFIRNWLYEHVHKHGRAYTSQELLENATGKKFTSDAYIDYLTNKYNEIYALR
jgi:carboxypeptidase Taq